MRESPMDDNSINRIAAIYSAFAEHEARGRSALYESLARRMTGDSVALSFIAEFPLEPASLETPWPTSVPRERLGR